jgi:hypothetical protein
VVSTFQRGLKLGIVSVDANAMINEMVGITDPTVSLETLEDIPLEDFTEILFLTSCTHAYMEALL